MKIYLENIEFLNKFKDILKFKQEVIIHKNREDCVKHSSIIIPEKQDIINLVYSQNDLRKLLNLEDNNTKLDVYLHVFSDNRYCGGGYEWVDNDSNTNSCPQEEQILCRTDVSRRLFQKDICDKYEEFPNLESLRRLWKKNNINKINTYKYRSEVKDWILNVYNPNLIEHLSNGGAYSVSNVSLIRNGFYQDNRKLKKIYDIDINNRINLVFSSAPQVKEYIPTNYFSDYRKVIRNTSRIKLPNSFSKKVLITGPFGMGHYLKNLNENKQKEVITKNVLIMKEEFSNSCFDFIIIVPTGRLFGFI